MPQVPRLVSQVDGRIDERLLRSSVERHLDVGSDLDVFKSFRLPNLTQMMAELKDHVGASRHLALLSFGQVILGLDMPGLT